jgi:hypothetical protein
MSGFRPLEEAGLGLETNAYAGRLKGKFEGCVQTCDPGISSALACYLLQMIALGWKGSLDLTMRDLGGFSLLEPGFEQRYQSHISQVKSILSAHISRNPLLPLSSLVEDFHLQISLFIPTQSKTELYTCTHPGRHLRVFLLDHDGQRILITKKLKVGLEQINGLGRELVLGLMWKEPKEAVNAGNTKESERFVLNCLENGLSLAGSILKRLRTLIASDPSMKYCKSSTFANSLIKLYPSLTRLKSNPALKGSIQAFFTDLCQELASFHVPYHFILSCERPNCKKLVDIVMEGCGHQVCKDCICELARESGWKCFCGVEQREEVLKQDWEVYQVMRNGGNGGKCCYVCNRRRPIAFFVNPTCCEQPTCSLCLNAQEWPFNCRFCHRILAESSQIRPFTLPCEHCGAAQESPTYCPNYDILCNACQFQSICQSFCVHCRVSYPSNTRSKLQKQLLFTCIECGLEKQWGRMVQQQACRHLLCMSCHAVAGQVPNCRICGVSFDSQGYKECMQSAWDYVCVSCDCYIDENEEDIHTLRCSHPVHKSCIPALMDKNEFKCRRCKVEIDQILLINNKERENVSEYMRSMGMMWTPVCPNACKVENETIIHALDTAEPWTCTICSQQTCVLCEEKWNNEHEMDICAFAIAYRRMQQLETDKSKQIAQCPGCLYVNEQDSGNVMPICICKSCKVAFCSGCCVAEKAIQEHGITYHRENCHYYPNRLGELQALRCEKCQDRPQPCRKPATLKRSRRFTPEEYRIERLGLLALL